MSNLGQGIWDKAHEEDRMEGLNEMVKKLVDSGLMDEQSAFSFVGLKPAAGTPCEAQNGGN